MKRTVWLTHMIWMLFILTAGQWTLFDTVRCNYVVGRLVFAKKFMQIPNPCLNHRRFLCRKVEHFIVNTELRLNQSLSDF